MIDQARTEELTAIHEAGHAVAHFRLGIRQAVVTIAPDADRLGSVKAEGAGTVWSKERAADMAIAFCGGYAALVSACESMDVALGGADDDFEHTVELINFWGLAGDLESWKGRAVELMMQMSNQHTIHLITN